MALSRTKRDEMAQGVANIYSAVEDQLLYNIAKRISNHGTLLDEFNMPSWEAEQLREMNRITQSQPIIIARGANVAIDEVARLLQEVGFDVSGDLRLEVEEAVRQGFPLISDTTPEGNINRALEAYIDQAKDSLNLTNTTMLGASQQAYRDIINRTVGLVAAGQMSPQEALRKAIREWADKGITGLVDSAGRNWTPEAYINMVMRTTIGNAARKVQDVGMDHYGIELVEVSSHIGARPLCAPHQGRIFSREGYTHPDYPNIMDTSIGQPAGLFGINCGHVPYPHFPGISIQRNMPYETEANDAVYKESQRQRAIERTIRKYKRSQNMLKAAGDPEGAEQMRLKVREWQANMREFTESTGRTRRYGREAVYEL